MIQKKINRAIFRAYDIRGLVGSDLTADSCYLIGRAIGAQIQSQGMSACNLAFDGRLSSPELAQAVQQGLLQAGCEVNFLGAAPTGLLYFSTYYLSCPNGVMITGSHNPPEYNGIKIVINQEALSAGQIQALYQRIEQQDLPQKTPAAVHHISLQDAYLNSMQPLHLVRPLKVVIDAGNGIAGPLAIQLMQRLKVQADYLYCDVDGRFPNHHPDPSQAKNLSDLQHAVLRNQADLGLAFDGDGDRTALVDNLGQIIWPDRLLMLLIADILPRSGGGKVLFDIKSSGLLRHFIRQLGGEPVMGPTGHSLMKANMKRTQAVVGGEFSGHLYLQDRWFGFDDGLYVAARLLETLSRHAQPVSAVFANLPDELSTPELTIDSTDERKFHILELLAQDKELLAGVQVFTDDGLRLELDDAWGLIRASNTTPKLTLRFAGQSETALLAMQQRVKAALKRQAPELNIPF